MNATARRSVNSVLAALRTYGLVDRFALCALFRGDALPSYEAVLDRLQRNEDALPPGISAEHLARHVLASVDEDAHIIGGKLENGQPLLTMADAAELDAILTGTVASRKYATPYQRHIRRLISGLFVGRLEYAGSEVNQFGGVGRIDILYRNAATSGFFDEIMRRGTLRGGYVPVECKNYRDDPKNPDVGQVLMRLNPSFGMLGIIACRTAEDRDSIFARCIPYAHREPPQWVIVLCDRDFRRMIEAHLAGDVKGVEAPLYDQMQRLALG